MAKVLLPAKNDLYTLMMAISAIIFVIGVLINANKLSDYKGGSKVEPINVQLQDVPAAPAGNVDAAATDNAAAPVEKAEPAAKPADEAKPADDAKPADADAAKDAPADEAKPADDTKAEE